MSRPSSTSRAHRRDFILYTADGREVDVFFKDETVW